MEKLLENDKVKQMEANMKNLESEKYELLSFKD